MDIPSKFNQLVFATVFAASCIFRLGVFMGLTIFGCRWVATRVQAYFADRKVPAAIEAS